MSETIDLGNVPLFADFSPEQVRSFVAACERVELPEEHVIFERGGVPKELYILIDGAVSVRDEDGEKYLVRPVAPIGELGAITGEDRNLSAVVAKPSTFLRIELGALQRFFSESGQLAFLFHRNLLRLTARKIARDRRRLREMRENIVSTQKAMKRMREALLEGEDSPLHAALFEELDALIERNRKIHYLVEPSRLVPTRVRLDDGSVQWVTAISNEWLYFERPAAGLKSEGKEWSGVLLLGNREIAVSGTVERVTERECAVDLDPLIAEYEEQLAEHLVRAQMLDVVL